MASEDSGAAVANALEPVVAAMVLAYLLYRVLKIVLKVSTLKHASHERCYVFGTFVWDPSNYSSFVPAVLTCVCAMCIMMADGLLT